MKDGKEKLLGITQAANLLGIHPLTLRSWADKGYVPFYKTPGGHRRFRQRDLDHFLNKINQGTPESTLVTVAHQAVQQAIASPPERQFPIKELALSEPRRETMRLVGQKMMGLTIQYVSGNADEVILMKGREVGYIYGKFARRNGMSISETVATFNFFCETIIEATFGAIADSVDLDASNPQLYRRLNRFFNNVLLATIEVVEGIKENSSNL